MKTTLISSLALALFACACTGPETGRSYNEPSQPPSDAAELVSMASDMEQWSFYDALWIYESAVKKAEETKSLGGAVPDNVSNKLNPISLAEIKMKAEAEMNPLVCAIFAIDSESSPVKRCELASFVAVKLSESGDNAAAIILLESKRSALAMWSLRPEDEAKALLDLAKGFAAASSLPEATSTLASSLDAALEVDDVARRLSLCVKIAKAGENTLDAGLCAKARKAVEKHAKASGIDESNQMLDTYDIATGIILSLPQTADSDKALSTLARAIHDAQRYVEDIRNVNLAETLSGLNELDNEPLKWETFSEMARLLAEHGKIPDATAIASMISDSGVRSRTFGAISRSSTSSKLMKEALIAATSIEDGTKGDALLEVGLAAASEVFAAGKREKSAEVIYASLLTANGLPMNASPDGGNANESAPDRLATMAGFGRILTSSEAMARACEGLITCGDLDGAKKIAALCSPADNAMVLARIARAHSAMLSYGEAASALAEAFASIGGMNDAAQLTRTLAEIGVMFPQAGMLDFRIKKTLHEVVRPIR